MILRTEAMESGTHSKNSFFLSVEPSGQSWRKSVETGSFFFSYTLLYTYTLYTIAKETFSKELQENILQKIVFG